MFLLFVFSSKVSFSLFLEVTVPREEVSLEAPVTTNSELLEVPIKRVISILADSQVLGENPYLSFKE